MLVRDALPPVAPTGHLVLKAKTERTLVAGHPWAYAGTVARIEGTPETGDPVTLAAADGTPAMQDIARAVQEGATAFLSRQFRTLGVFAVVAFFLLLALPALLIAFTMLAKLWREGGQLVAERGTS